MMNWVRLAPPGACCLLAKTFRAKGTRSRDVAVFRELFKGKAEGTWNFDLEGEN